MVLDRSWRHEDVVQAVSRVLSVRGAADLELAEARRLAEQLALEEAPPTQARLRRLHLAIPRALPLLITFKYANSQQDEILVRPLLMGWLNRTPALLASKLLPADLQSFPRWLTLPVAHQFAGDKAPREVPIARRFILITLDEPVDASGLGLPTQVTFDTKLGSERFGPVSPGYHQDRAMWERALLLEGHDGRVDRRTDWDRGSTVAGGPTHLEQLCRVSDLVQSLIIRLRTLEGERPASTTLTLGRDAESRASVQFRTNSREGLSALPQRLGRMGLGPDLHRSWASTTSEERRYEIRHWIFVREEPGDQSMGGAESMERCVIEFRDAGLAIRLLEVPAHLTDLVGLVATAFSRANGEIHDLLSVASSGSNGRADGDDEAGA